MSGWIKMHRDIWKWKYAKNPNYMSVWIYLLCNVNHKDNFARDGVLVKKGQLLTGRKRLSREIGISESQCERILKKLEIEQQIEQQKTNKHRVISVLNWHQYQESEQQIEQQVNNKRTTNEQQADTNKNVKNVKNEENENNKRNNTVFDFEKIYDAYPRKTGKINGLKNCKRNIKTQKQYDEFNLAVSNYAKTCEQEKTEMRYVKHFSTFTNCWQDYLNIEKKQVFDSSLDSNAIMQALTSGASSVHQCECLNDKPKEKEFIVNSGGLNHLNLISDFDRNKLIKNYAV